MNGHTSGRPPDVSGSNASTIRQGRLKDDRDYDSDYTKSERLAAQLEGEEAAKSLQRSMAKEEELNGMQGSNQGKAWLFVQQVLEVHKRFASNHPSIAFKTGVVATDDMFHMAYKMIQLQDKFIALGKPCHVDLGVHYTQKKNLEQIRSVGLMNRAERKDNKVSAARTAGSVFGEGIYTGNNPVAFRRYGDVGLLVARLKGTIETRSLSSGLDAAMAASLADTVVGNKLSMTKAERSFFNEVVLQKSDQVVPLVRYCTSLVVSTSSDRSNEWALHTNDAWFYALDRDLQQLVDNVFNRKAANAANISNAAPSGRGASFGGFAVSAAAPATHGTCAAAGAAAAASANTSTSMPAMGFAASTYGGVGTAPSTAPATALSAVWVEERASNWGLSIYRNTVTGETSWVQPSGFAATSTVGVNWGTNNSSAHPSIGTSAGGFTAASTSWVGGSNITALPAGWVEVTSTWGVSLYKNQITGETSWVKPGTAATSSSAAGVNWGTSNPSAHTGASAGSFATATAAATTTRPSTGAVYAPTNMHCQHQRRAPTTFTSNISNTTSTSSAAAEVLRYYAPPNLSTSDCACDVFNEPAREAEECIVCFDPLKAKSAVKIKLCGHVFHKECLDASLSRKNNCPVCRKPVGEPRGAMPSGKMTIERSNAKCDGFSNCGSIVIHYTIGSGTQLGYMENPGRRYSGTKRTAYIPDNDKGAKLLKRLKYAFMRGLTFNVGESQTTGQRDVVTWASIHHKTRTSGGTAVHGFPDPAYFLNVNAELDNLDVPCGGCH